MVKKDLALNTVQVFTPYKVMAVTEDGDVNFSKGDIAFRNPVQISYTIDGGTEVLLAAGTVTGIINSSTYTFSAASSIEVM